MSRSTKQNYVRCRACVLTLTFALGGMENLGSTRDNNKHETHGWVNLTPSPLPHAVMGGPWPTMFCGADSVLVGTKDILGAHDERFRGDQGDPWGTRRQAV